MGVMDAMGLMMNKSDFWSSPGSDASVRDAMQYFTVQVTLQLLSIVTLF